MVSNLIISDFLVNVAAGWFGAIFITQTYQQIPRKKRTSLVIINTGAMIACLVIAYKFRISI
ncbi:hypothetical protein A3F34_00800 [Candidatus Roizmanbacteria bacterium RIFCSPHIGHO2_12_FULL_44_10]|uniref:Uncharacterized protein n=1 Tax=Candidatus Roizmanbacteria bacterium RIFCSPHIGHO2_12_FULL_44_10 TaxID=1802054 RepID=A0A1F7I7Z7_9BACT|nr:MAG: hypothetical protein A3F34_00800 [Candidatus Roizmanbacteria bacterium RIFCSPHIGHO2_12_FULL_44_10]